MRAAYPAVQAARTPSRTAVIRSRRPSSWHASRCSAPFSTRGIWVSTRTPTSPPPQHLGSWTSPNTITFGKDGKPFYVFGFYDDPRSVIRTLERTVGHGNFDVLAIAG